MNQYGVKAIFRFTQVNRERLVKLAQWVDQNNNIKINIDRKFTLDQAGKALDYQKDIHPRGKKLAPSVYSTQTEDSFSSLGSCVLLEMSTPTSPVVQIYCFTNTNL